MPAPATRNLVPEQFALPRTLDNIKVTDLTTLRIYLEQLGIILTELITIYSSAINNLMTNRTGDTFQGKLQFSSTVGEIILPVIVGDPAAPTNGEIWYNSSLAVFRRRRAGVTETW